jgi:hypothetical protein
MGSKKIKRQFWNVGSNSQNSIQETLVLAW